jgi:riboflavin synthase, alpha subunit
MFTGIVEEIGKVYSIKRGTHSAVLNILANKILEDIHIGDSIAVNGICLTVTNFNKQSFSADVMHETLNRSSLSDISTGDFVNLERAMSIGSRFGGHIVSGHVDSTGEITYIKKDDNAILYTIKADKKTIRYIVEKGSITIDGISLTVVTVTEKSFTISAIPHTVDMTILNHKKVGDKVNLEVDMIGKYVERFISYIFGESTISNDANRLNNLVKKDNLTSIDITKDLLEKYGF